MQLCFVRILANGTIDKLLRVRKDLPTTLPCAISQAGFIHLIRPEFEEHQLVNQILVKLWPAGIIERLNAELRATIPRPVARQGTYLAEDEYGLLITDMTGAYTYMLSSRS